MGKVAFYLVVTLAEKSISDYQLNITIQIINLN
jgi:hypothetical protein